MNIVMFEEKWIMRCLRWERSVSGDEQWRGKDIENDNKIKLKEDWKMRQTGREKRNNEGKSFKN